MPYEGTYTRSGVAFRFSGDVTGAELYQANQEVHAHQYEESLRYCLLDLTEATSVDVDTETIQRLAQQDQMHLAGQPVVLAAIVAPAPLEFGLARMWEAYAEGAPIQSIVVRSRVAALEFFHSHGVDP